MKNVTLKPNPFSSVVTIPAMEGRAAEIIHLIDVIYRTDIPGTDLNEYGEQPSFINISEEIPGYGDLEYTHTYTSPIDGKVFKIKVIYFDMSNWSEEQESDFYAEWNTEIDSLILIF